MKILQKFRLEHTLYTVNFLIKLKVDLNGERLVKKVIFKSRREKGLEMIRAQFFPLQWKMPPVKFEGPALLFRAVALKMQILVIVVNLMILKFSAPQKPFPTWAVKLPQRSRLHRDFSF